MSTKPTLGYWQIRGYAQPIRYLLVVAGVEFNDKQYPFGNGDTPEHVLQYWHKEKFTLGLEFPNLPYWIDGDIKLTQTMAILKYLARKHGLIAQNVNTLAKQEMIEQQLTTCHTFIDFLYSDNFNEQKGNEVKTTIVQYLDQLNNNLGDNQWFSPEFSYIDAIAYEVLDWFKQTSPNTFSKYPRLNLFMTRFENLPSIQKYQNSNDFKNLTIFSSFAKLGN